MKKNGQSGAGPREALSRELVLRAAMEIMDTQGIEGLSMRMLGAKLGVEAMSLYNHVANKDDIIDGALDLVVAEITIPEAQAEWKAAMKSRAASALQVFKQHPWASRLMDSRLSSHPARLRYFDRMIETLCCEGFSLEIASRAFSLLDSYVYGFLRQLANLSAKGNLDYHEQARLFQKILEDQSYPYLAKMTEFAMTQGYDEEADFEFGLNLIVDGLEKLLNDKA